MDASAAPRLFEWLDGRREAMVALVERLARIESPSGDQAALDDVRAALSDELAKLDYDTRLLARAKGAATLYARPSHRHRGSAFQLLLGHCDTVWPRGTLARMPVKADDAIVRGPGVFDMKAGLVQMIFALAALRALELVPPATPVVLINADEEVGSPASTPLIRRFAEHAARAFVLEPAFDTDGKLKTARKAVGRFTVVVRGKAAHAGISPEQGASAILELSHQVQQLFALNDAARGITVNVGTIDGGLGANVVAPEARAVADVRVRNQSDAEEIEQALRALRPTMEGTEVEVEGRFGRPAMEANAQNQALWRLAHGLGRQLGLELEQAAVGGASDGNTTSQYTATLDGLGGVGDGAHAPHEHTKVSAMVSRSALLAMLLLAPLADDARKSRQE
ncbi:MAG: M20 family peptidase [Planctomycetota bacterium]|nr:MAG: M20 family peptidase [Planctomycetota bacterium]